MNNYIKVTTEKNGEQLFEVEDSVCFAYDNDRDEFRDNYNIYSDSKDARKEIIEKNWITVPQAWKDIVINANKWELVSLDIWAWKSVD